MKIVSLQELQTSLETCLRAVRDGDTLVIMDGENEVARLIPPSAHAADRLVAPRHLMTYDDRLAFYSKSRPPLLKGATSAEILDWLREDKI